MRTGRAEPITRLCGCALASLLALALILPATSAAGLPGRFDSPAHFRAGNQLLLSGTIAGCPRGAWVFLSVTVTQGKIRATGDWPHLSCTGRRHHWSLTAVAKSGHRRAGTANAAAVAKTFKFFRLCIPRPPCVKDAKIVAVKRWRAKLAVVPASIEAGARAPAVRG